jgi:DNA sulfur modification protein DndD
MKFKSIEIENFGPYFGLNKISLETNSNSPVILIHGENERGKTSLLHAFRWCLYGRTKDHSNRQINEMNFANWDAAESGEDFRVSVTLVLSTEDNEITLTRSYLVSKVNKFGDARKTDTRVECLAKNGNAYASEDVPILINDLLPEDISEFFLFDGESLRDFEEKLSADSLVATEFVKDSIEKALGLPALTLIVDHLNILRNTVNKELKDFFKQKGLSENLLREISQVETYISIKEKNINELNYQIEISNKRIKELKPLIDANATLKEKYELRNSLAESISKSESENSVFISEIAQMVSKFWLPANTLIARTKDDIDSEIDSITKNMFDISDDNFRRTIILRTLESNLCEFCHQTLAAEEIVNLKRELVELDRVVGNDKSLKSRFESLSAKKNNFRLFSDAKSDIEKIKIKDKQILSNKIRIESWKSELKRLDEILDKITYNSSLEREYQSELGLVEKSKAEIPIVSRKVEEDKLTLSKLNSQLKKDSSSESPLQHKIDLIDLQIRIFSDAVTTFREKMRSEIEKSATKIFKVLTSEKQYDKLKINESYFLQILDDNNRVVKTRSQGAEQLVTMSLIGALIECSVREAPVIMDTPLGRLDTTHGSNILKWIPEMSSQVMLFVTSREFREKEDRPKLGTKIGYEYSLVRDSVSRTRIEKTNHGR